jgi:tRNA A-37 threonylcarbamoyl transferase component Bud32
MGLKLPGASKPGPAPSAKEPGMAPQLDKERPPSPPRVVDDSGERVTVLDAPDERPVPVAEPSAEAIEIEDFIIRTGPGTSAAKGPAGLLPANLATISEPRMVAEPSRQTDLPPAPAADAWVREEAARARGFARALVILCGIGVASQFWLASPAWLMVVLTLTFVAVATTSVCTWRVAVDPAKYTTKQARIFGGVAAVAAVIIPYGLGVFSPAPVVVILGITFFALGSDRLSAIGLPVVVSLGYALVSGLIIDGLLPDIGMIRAASLSHSLQVTIAFTVPVVYLLALWQGRLSRGAIMEAIERSNAAVRDAARAAALRDKQLERVNKDLDRLLSLGAGEPGAYTGEECGRYMLGKLVGRGAMAEVYAANDPKSGATAAVKLLQPNLAPDSNLVLRFLREGEAASKLRAPNVVTIYEVGKTRDGAPYIAMELLRGHDLGWHLRQRIRIPLEEMLGIVDQVATGLEAARVAGVVHRDLKPQNIFLAQQERAAPIWKILDFGVSRIMGSSGTLTQDMVVGTPAYMSPEQAGGTDATHRSDVFSFGAMTYRALTGELPFDAPDTPQVLYKVVYKNPPRPSEVCPDLPPDVDLVLAIALAKDKEDRFASGLEFAAALRDGARGQLHRSMRLHGTTVLAAHPWDSMGRQSQRD